MKCVIFVDKSNGKALLKKHGSMKQRRNTASSVAGVQYTLGSRLNAGLSLFNVCCVTIFDAI